MATVLTRRMLIGLMLLGAPSFHAQAEMVISVFGGAAFTENNNLRLRQGGGTDLTLHNVGYSGKNDQTPPYYGGRLVYFLPQQTHWGFGVEFFHAKLYLNAGDTVHVTGSRAGTPVDASEPVSSSITAFSIS